MSTFKIFILQTLRGNIRKNMGIEHDNMDEMMKGYMVEYKPMHPLLSNLLCQVILLRACARLCAMVSYDFSSV